MGMVLHDIQNSKNICGLCGLEFAENILSCPRNHNTHPICIACRDRYAMDESDGLCYACKEKAEFLERCNK